MTPEFSSLVAEICINARASQDLGEAVRIAVEALLDDEFWQEFAQARAACTK